MKTNKLRLAAALLVPAMWSRSTAQAAQPIQWNDLATKIGRDHAHLQYRVITKDGAVHGAYGLTFSPGAITVLHSGSSIPRAHVTEIRIHHVRRLSDALLAPAGKIFDSLCPCTSEDFGCLSVGPWCFL